MVLIPLHPNKFCNAQVLTVAKSIGPNGKSFTGNSYATQKMPMPFSSISGDNRWQALHQGNEKTGGGVLFHTVHKKLSLPFQDITKLSILCALSNRESQETSESSGTQKQQTTLDSYFNKLQNKTCDQQNTSTRSRGSEMAPDSEKNKMGPSSQFSSKTRNLHERSDQFKAKKELDSLEDYLGKRNAELNSQKTFSSLDNKTTNESPVRAANFGSGAYVKRDDKEENNYVQLGIKDDEPGLENYQDLLPQNEASDLYLICMLASINIAVFLFEIASPVTNSSTELFTLPSLYGAKINQLILDGEWWRLVTPMFLHSGIIHVALGSWVLLTIGPQVCRGYGPCTFFLIYMLGGISGNLTSFLHTPEPTIGGTGPVFAIIGAWLIYQVQNKEVISKEASESMFQKAVIATALSSVLSNFGPIDDWTHLGAACAGIAYGYLTCPRQQLDDASSKHGQEDGLALVKRYPDSRKSIIVFTVFLLILSSLFFFLEPQVRTLQDSFV